MLPFQASSKANKILKLFAESMIMNMKDKLKAVCDKKELKRKKKTEVNTAKHLGSSVFDVDIRHFAQISSN